MRGIPLRTTHPLMVDYILTQTNQTYSDLNGPSNPNLDWPADGLWEFGEEGRYNFDFDQASAAAIYEVPGIIGWRIDIHLHAAGTEGSTLRLYWNLNVNPNTLDDNYVWGPADNSPGSYFDFSPPGGQDYTQLITDALQYIGHTYLTPYEVLHLIATGEPGDGFGNLIGSYTNPPGETVYLSRFDVVFFTGDPVIRKTARRDSRGHMTATRIGGEVVSNRIGGGYQ